MCSDLRTAIATHPGIGLLASTTLLTRGPRRLELTEAALDLLIEMGLERGDAALAYVASIRFISGTGGAEDHVRAAGQSEEECQEALRATYASVPLDRFPHVSEMAETLMTRGFDEHFEFGIDVLLAGIVAKAGHLPA